MTKPMVCERDRAAMARQAAALLVAEQTDEGSPTWRADAHEWLDEQRASLGIHRLATEGEFHRYAASLGLLRRPPLATD
jgi:hypothetical protein